MKISKFNEIVNSVKTNNSLLFELEHDTIPSEKDIVEFEKQYNVLLTEKYKQVLLKYGGGFFGYANIYSLDKKSHFYILNNNPFPLSDILYIADNECGDYYFLKIVDGICQDNIFFYNHEIDNVSNTKFSDIFEYLAEVGLRR